MPHCNKALQFIASQANENPGAFREWIDGGWFRSMSAQGPIPQQPPEAEWQELSRELRALPRSVLPLLIDAGDLAVHSNRRVEFEAPDVGDERADEFKREKKVRIELEYTSEKISLKLFHLGAEDQDRWYAPSVQQSPAFSYMFR